MTKKLFGIALGLVLVPILTPAQVTAIKFTVHIPESIATGKKIYLAGSFNHWFTKDSLYQLKKKSENRYSVTIPVFQGVWYEYKYTLGNWDEVEVALNDSDIHNRSFFSAKGKAIVDTVMKWKMPTTQTKSNNQAVQKFQPLKDSLIASFQSRQNEMLALLKEYLINQLQEKPSTTVNEKITNEVVKNLVVVYGSIDRASSKIFGELTLDQKEKILKSITVADTNQDIINVFLKAFSEAVKN